MKILILISNLFFIPMLLAGKGSGGGGPRMTGNYISIPVEYISDIALNNHTINDLDYSLERNSSLIHVLRFFQLCGNSILTRGISRLALV